MQVAAVADYAELGPTDQQAAWVAQVGTQRVGSILLVPDEQPRVAKLRILLVTPAGRGLRLGSRLLATSLDFARSAGYQSVTLWTNDVLASARRIYQEFGFDLVSQEAHHSFGHDLIGQNWTLRLD